jgi:hypothetical protein
LKQELIELGTAMRHLKCEGVVVWRAALKTVGKNHCTQQKTKGMGASLQRMERVAEV